MKKNIMNLIKFIINFVFLFPILIIVNLYFPILNKYIKKFRVYKINNLTKEDEKKLNSSIAISEKNFKIEKDFIKKFNESLKPFIKKEKYIVQDIKTNEYNYLKLRYAFRIIEQAKEAIIKLEEVSKNNRKVSYYESGKNSNLDKLIEEYSKQLNEQEHKKLMLFMSKKEIRFKRVIAKLQKQKSLFFNFYLTLFTLNPMEELKIKKEDKEIFEMMKSLYNFYRVGHATNDQIYKSVTIQLFYFYRNDFEKEELKTYIGDLITSSFCLNYNYQNFNNIREQPPYIKNLIYNFPLFECNTEQENKQKKVIYSAFVLSNKIFPKYIPKFIRKYLFKKYITNLLSFYQQNDTLNFFGSLPIKK